MKLLIFGNQLDSRDVLTTFFKSKLVVVDETPDLDEAIDLTRFYEYDVVLLRVSDTRSTDIELIRRLRLAGLRCPIMAVAHSLSEATRLRILEAGIDDLIINAVSNEEIFLRVQNQVRRSRGFQSPSLSIGNVEINMNAKKIYVSDNEISLTKKEYQIVEILALRKGCVLSKEAILDHLYGGLDEPNPKIIDVFICKIRKKLQKSGADDLIQTNWGRGYMVVDRRERPIRTTEPETSPQLGMAPRPKTYAGYSA